MRARCSVLSQGCSAAARARRCSARLRARSPPRSPGWCSTRGRGSWPPTCWTLSSRRCRAHGRAHRRGRGRCVAQLSGHAHVASSGMVGPDQVRAVCIVIAAPGRSAAKRLHDERLSRAALPADRRFRWSEAVLPRSSAYQLRKSGQPRVGLPWCCRRTASSTPRRCHLNSGLRSARCNTVGSGRWPWCAAIAGRCSSSPSARPR